MAMISAREEGRWTNMPVCAYVLTVRPRPLSIRILLLALCAFTFSAACGGAAAPAASSGRPGWPTELRFALGVNPHDNEAVLNNKPFVDRIEKATGLKVTLF